ncbi:MAG: hypothetical protein E7532_04605 [Ruminococcaceae bacterium]|nr:hypothetical protein [Oscillospiraceae bacterium]
MKLFLRRDKSDESSRFVVSDECGRDIYKICGKKGACVDRMALINTKGDTLLKVIFAPFSFFTICNISTPSEHFSLFINGYKNTDYKFYGVDWNILKSSDGLSFEIINNDKSVVMIQSISRASSDLALTLEIFDSSKDLFCVAVCACVNMLNLDGIKSAATVNL